MFLRVYLSTLVAIAAANQAMAGAPIVPMPKLYVCNNEGTDFMVVDMKSHKVVKTVDVGGKPHGLTVTAKGDRAYISCSGPDDVIAIDTRTEEILWRIKVGPNPHQLTVTPDGRFVYVSIFGTMNGHTTDVIDTKLQKRIKSIETGHGPHVAYSPSNGHAYVTAWFDKHVSVIDTSRQEVVQTIHCPGLVRPIAIDKAEKWMYIALSGFHGFVVADLELGRVVDTIENPPYPADTEMPEHYTPTHGMEIRPGEKELYVTSVIHNRIFVYDIPKIKLSGTIEVGVGPNWITFSPDGRRAYVSNAFENTVSAIDTDKRKVIATIHVGEAPKRLAVVGDRTR